ncbi:MAG: serine protease [Candidatus Hydrogenedentota bacterium]
MLNAGVLLTSTVLSRTIASSFIVAFTLICVESVAQKRTIQKVADDVLGSVVLIVMTVEFGATVSFGSGFSVASGRIATNQHVIDGASKGKIIYDGGNSEVEITGLVGVSFEHDLAIITVEELDIAPLKLREEPPLDVGDTVYAVGSPRGQAGTFSSGIVSALRIANVSRHTIRNRPSGQPHSIYQCAYAGLNANPF